MALVSMTMRFASRTFATLWLGLVIHPLAPVCADGAEPNQNGRDTNESALGSIDGLVTFQGKIPKSPTPDDTGVQRDLLRVEATSRGLANVVVWLTADDARLTNRTSATPAAPALMDQRDHEFVPRVIAVIAGQPVKFSNSDPANHNVRTSSSLPKNEFNVFTGVDGFYTHRFAADPQQRPIRLGCDIHPWMRGWIYVFQHPYFAVTDERGRFRIHALPAGQYVLALRQPDIHYARQESVTVSNDQPTKVQFVIRAEDVKKPRD